MIRTVAMLFAGAVAFTPAAGQSVSFQFSFSNPGARSAGFGGAFVALADDATAAFANPAGLVQLLKPEVSIEGRSWNYSTPYFSGGGFGGPPSGVGIDTISGVSTARSDVDLEGPSFVSYVYPLKKWSLALYRHQLADYEFTGETQGIFVSGFGRVEDLRGATELDVITHTVVGAYRLTEGLSLGVGLAHFEGDLRQVQEKYRWDDDTPDGLFGRNSFLPDRLVDAITLTIDDQAWAPSAGLLWRNAAGWSLGATYRQGPELDAAADIVAGPAHATLEPGAFVDGRFPLDFPDVFGLGAAYRSPTGRLTTSFEWDRVEYSTLLTSYRAGLEALDDGITVGGRLDDIVEIHLGIEYVFFKPASPIAIRWGVWSEPDHQVSPGTLAGQDIVVGDDEIHYAVGLGAAFQRFQIDLAADFSGLRDTLSFSAIYRY